MKRVLLVILFFVCSISYGQLSEVSEFYKKEMPELYNSIKEFSVNKWKDDHQMVVYEINQQSQGFFKMTQYVKENKENEAFTTILLNAISKWSEGDISDLTKNNTIDWNMVVYEMENQVKALNAY